jgi:hypothetical protein
MVNALSEDGHFPPAVVRNISLAEMYAADEVFTTGRLLRTPVKLKMTLYLMLY